MVRELRTALKEAKADAKIAVALLEEAEQELLDYTNAWIGGQNPSDDDS